MKRFTHLPQQAVFLGLAFSGRFQWRGAAQTNERQM